MKNKIILLGIGLVGLFVLGIYQLVTFSDDKLHVVFCDVGQGDAVFIRTANKVDILIDGGPDDSVLRCLSDHMPFWDRKIDLVFATHPDADHITGLIDVVKRYQIGSFGTSIEGKTEISKELKRTVEDKGLKTKYIQEGDRVRIRSKRSENRRIRGSEGSEESENSENSEYSDKSDDSDLVVLETLWPQGEYVRTRPSGDTNSYSLVQRLTYGKTSVLLTGDVTFDIFNQIMDPSAGSGPSAGHSIDILKAPHHGSYTGINEDTFLYSKPQIVIISAGKNNRYGHPHTSVLKELKARRIPYLRTDELGDIEFVSEGEKIWLEKD